MLKSSKFKAVIVIVLIGALAGGGLLLVRNIQNNQQLNNSEAAGFGSSATTTNFANVENDFLASECDEFIPSLITSDNPAFYSYTKDSFITITSNPPYERYPKSCTYNLGQGRIINFGIFTYTKDSKIDNSQNDLFNRIENLTLKDVVSEGTYGDNNIISYLLGHNRNDSSQCTSVIFHSQNDFEYAYLNYTGFGDCKNISKLNDEAVTLVSQKILKIMAKYPVL